MNISWMTLRDLEYLVGVARHMHFRKAAEACHVSQPALSAQIRKVEGLLGFPLFERTNRRVAVTEKGRQVVELARVVLEEAQKIGDFAGDTGPAGVPQGLLRVGSIATLGPYYVPHFLAPLRKAFPKLEPWLQEGLTEDLLAGLRSGEMDLVLAARTFDEKGFRVFDLFEEPFVLALPAHHPMTKKKRLSARDLDPNEMVLLEDGHCLRDQALEICPPNHRGSIRRYHATSLETLRHLVAAGMGYTLMPELAVQPESQMKGLLKYRKLQGHVGRTIVAVCRERYPRLQEVETLVKFLREIAPEFSS